MINPLSVNVKEKLQRQDCILRQLTELLELGRMKPGLKQLTSKNMRENQNSA